MAKKIHVSVHPYGIAAEEIEGLCEGLGFEISSARTNAGEIAGSRISQAITPVENCDVFVAVQTEKDLDSETALKVGYALARGKTSILLNLTSYKAAPVMKACLYEVDSHGALISCLKVL